MRIFYDRLYHIFDKISGRSSDKINLKFVHFLQEGKMVHFSCFFGIVFNDSMNLFFHFPKLPLNHNIFLCVLK